MTDAVHKVRYTVLKVCGWNSFHAHPPKVLAPEEMVTDLGTPLPDDVVDVMVKSGSLVRSEWWTNPALLDACRASPDDDLPRLVMADWLEEHGQPDWAGVIRMMLIRRGAKYAVDDRRTRAGRRIGPLLDRVFPVIRPSVDGMPPDLRSGETTEVSFRPRCVFERGFINAVYCPWAWWEANADSVLDAAVNPTVVLTPGSVDRKAIAGLPTRWPTVREWAVPRTVMLMNGGTWANPVWHAIDLNPSTEDRR